MPGDWVTENVELVLTASDNIISQYMIIAELVLTASDNIISSYIVELVLTASDNRNEWQHEYEYQFHYYIMSVSISINANVIIRIIIIIIIIIIEDGSSFIFEAEDRGLKIGSHSLFRLRRSKMGFLHPSAPNIEDGGLFVLRSSTRRYAASRTLRLSSPRHERTHEHAQHMYVHTSIVYACLSLSLYIYIYIHTQHIPYTYTCIHACTYARMRVYTHARARVRSVFIISNRKISN